MGTINLVPFKPSAGALGDANQIDNAFDTLQTLLNGNVDDSNVNASSNVATQKGKALGLTGAVAATRFVGATASGAPVSGSFLVGDFVVDQTGKVWICTAAGSPGTWANSAGTSGGSGSELDFKEITADVTGINQTTEGTAATVITGNSVAYDGTKKNITVSLPQWVSTAGSPRPITVVLFSGASALGQVPWGGDAAGGPGYDFEYTWQDTPSPATFAYVAKVFVTAGTATIKAGAGTPGNFAKGRLVVTKA